MKQERTTSELSEGLLAIRAELFCVFERGHSLSVCFPSGWILHIFWGFWYYLSLISRVSSGFYGLLRLESNGSFVHRIGQFQNKDQHLKVRGFRQRERMLEIHFDLLLVKRS